jgi:hypothetical protein
VAERVNYRHEYVSGCVVVPVKSEVAGVTAIISTVFNRGDTDGVVRVLIYSQSSPSPKLVPDGGDGSVAAGQLWSESYEPGAFDGVPPGVYWLRILTTSPDLVPSVRFAQGGFDDSSGDALPYTPYAYISPGDFAIFSLPLRPDLPTPAGPIETE